MISKNAVQEAVNEWLTGKEYFLVDLSVSADDRVVVVIDHADGVWIEDCADLSRFIESHLDRDDEDYELEVGSAGLGQPFRVHRQYEIHVGKPVESQTIDGHKYKGTLLSVDAEGFDFINLQRIAQFDVLIADHTAIRQRRCTGVSCKILHHTAVIAYRHFHRNQTAGIALLGFQGVIAVLIEHKAGFFHRGCTV